MYAVVTTGGKQYRVEAGSELVIERLAEDAGASVTFDRVLLIGDGEAVTIGTPTVDGASVSGTILGEELGPKLIIFKFKQKATYRRTRGHRQHLVRVRIDEINASGKKAKAEKAEKADAPAAKASASAKTEATKKPARTRKPATAKAKADAPVKADAPAKPAPRRRSPTKKAESKE
ncbi:MAG: 50S ribosomal protein L21 [Candidatus Limnocylindria bacterium]